MKRYVSKSGKPSGATGYEIGDNYIIVQFDYSPEYKYSYNSCGRDITEELKRLALAGKDLSSFISQNDPKFEWKRQK